LTAKKNFICRNIRWQLAISLTILVLCSFAMRASAQAKDPASTVNPLIGTTNGGNDYPGAVMPFGMLAWSPEEPYLKPRPKVEGAPVSKKDDLVRTAAPGGYEYSATKIRGFALTHLMGTGCAGASGDVPFMPFVGAVSSSPASSENCANNSFRPGESSEPGS